MYYGENGVVGFVVEGGERVFRSDVEQTRGATSPNSRRTGAGGVRGERSGPPFD